MTDEVCCRCMEDFPLADGGEGVRMGLLYPLSAFAPSLQRRLGDPSTAYLCGNCYFDLTDDLV